MHGACATCRSKVAPGGAATLDHARLAPHAPGRIVKLQFRQVGGGLGATSAALSFDLSTRCDAAAYALVLTGTGGREDRYDPMVFGVAGAAAACVLTRAPTAAGPSAKVALLNTAPVPHAHQPAFQWGGSLLTLTYQSGAMGLGAPLPSCMGPRPLIAHGRRLMTCGCSLRCPIATSVAIGCSLHCLRLQPLLHTVAGELLLLDLPVGDSAVYARLVRPEPPHAPLTVARAVRTKGVVSTHLLVAGGRCVCMCCSESTHLPACLPACLPCTCYVLAVHCIDCPICVGARAAAATQPTARHRRARARLDPQRRLAAVVGAALGTGKLQ